jgi:hypothetical protein
MRLAEKLDWKGLRNSVGRRGLDWTDLAQDKNTFRAIVIAAIAPVSVKCEEFPG